MKTTQEKTMLESRTTDCLVTGKSTDQANFCNKNTNI
jgi:hypothetical protein